MASQFLWLMASLFLCLFSWVSLRFLLLEKIISIHQSCKRRLQCNSNMDELLTTTVCNNAFYKYVTSSERHLLNFAWIDNFRLIKSELQCKEWFDNNNHLILQLSIYTIPISLSAPIWRVKGKGLNSRYLSMFDPVV